MRKEEKIFDTLLLGAVTDGGKGPQRGDLGLYAERSWSAWTALDWEFCSKYSAELYSTAELSLDLTYLKPFQHSPEDQLDLEVWRASPTSSAATHTHLSLLLDNVRHF